MYILVSDPISDNALRHLPKLIRICVAVVEPAVFREQMCVWRFQRQQDIKGLSWRAKPSILPRV